MKHFSFKYYTDQAGLRSATGNGIRIIKSRIRKNRFGKAVCRHFRIMYNCLTRKLDFSPVRRQLGHYIDFHYYRYYAGLRYAAPALMVIFLAAVILTAASAPAQTNVYAVPPPGETAENYAQGEYAVLDTGQTDLATDEINALNLAPALEIPEFLPAAVVIEKDAPVSVIPRAFTSAGEAQDWLDLHHLPVRLVADGTGKIDFSRQHNDDYDCDDYARDFQQMALENGYIVNLCPVIGGEVWGVKVTVFTETHIACWVQIDDAYYYIETVPGVENSYRLVFIMNAD